MLKYLSFSTYPYIIYSEVGRLSRSGWGVGFILPPQSSPLKILSILQLNQHTPAPPITCFLTSHTSSKYAFTLSQSLLPKLTSLSLNKSYFFLTPPSTSHSRICSNVSSAASHIPHPTSCPRTSISTSGYCS